MSVGSATVSGPCSSDAPTTASGPWRSSRTITWMRAAEGDADQGADEGAQAAGDPAAQRGADQHGDQDPEGVELHRLAHDDRVEDVVLDLLVHEEDDQHDDPGRDRVDGGDDDDRDAGQQPAHQRQQVDQGDEDAQQQREGHAEDGQRDRPTMIPAMTEVAAFPSM